MGVIRYKKTALADPGTDWDGSRERAAAEISDLRVMCTWYDESRPDVKESYKLPHHRASDHYCVLQGVKSALRLLNAAEMPDPDRPGCRAHLQHHLEDFQARNQRVSLQADFLPSRPEPAARMYKVLAMTAGNGNGLEYPESVLEAAASLFDGVAVFVDHAQMAELCSMTGGRSVRNILGVLQQVSYSHASQGITGVLRVYPGPDANWFCGMLDQYLADKAAGRTVPRVGLSAVLDVKIKGREVVHIGRVVSVDAVFDPARGGEFIRALNSRRLDGGTVQRRQEQGGVQVGDELQNGQLARPAGTGTEARAGGQIVPSSGDSDRPAAEPIDQRLASVVLQELVELRLDRSRLPEPVKDMLRAEVQTPLDLSALDGRIEALQSAWAASVAVEGPQVHGVGRSDVEVGISELDRLQAVMDRLCGLTPGTEALQQVAPVSGIRELYLMLSGDYDFQGVFRKERVALANVTTSTMTSLVKNAFNKVILDWFNTVDLWWRPVVSEENFTSMKDLTLITLGGFADLPTVNEGAAYTELSWSDSEEVVSFVKKGAYVGVTLEMMDKDETRKFRAIPQKIASAGYRTLSSLISALFTDNSGQGPHWPSSQSTYYLFDSSYGNVATSALSASAWDAVIQAMYKQTEATSGKRMGIRPAHLLVPIELEKTALTIMQSAGEPGTADNDANVRRASSRVVVVPEWTDANDWAAVADPRVAPGVIVGYRFGRVPEVFTAGEETVGSMFTNDEMRIKARFIVAVGVGDYRPLFKQNAA